MMCSIKIRISMRVSDKQYVRSCNILHGTIFAIKIPLGGASIPLEKRLMDPYLVIVTAGTDKL